MPRTPNNYADPKLQKQVFLRLLNPDEVQSYTQVYLNYFHANEQLTTAENTIPKIAPFFYTAEPLTGLIFAYASFNATKNIPTPAVDAILRQREDISARVDSLMVLKESVQKLAQLQNQDSTYSQNIMNQIESARTTIQDYITSTTPPDSLIKEDEQALSAQRHLGIQGCGFIAGTLILLAATKVTFSRTMAHYRKKVLETHQKMENEFVRITRPT